MAGSVTISVTIEQIREDIRQMDDGLEEDSDGFKVAVIVLSSAIIGPNIKRLARFTGYGRDFCSEISRHCREGGLWRGGRVYHSGWDDEKTGGIAFWLDCALAQGYIERTKA